jgi:chromosome segregation ATPase
MKEIQSTKEKNQVLGEGLFELEKSLHAERLDINLLKEKINAQREQDQKELEKKSREIEMERNNLKQIQDKILMEKSNLDSQILNVKTFP